MEHIVKNKQLHLVMLGQDASLLDESSEAAQRIALYSQSFSGINAYVFAKKIPKKEKVYKNVSVAGFSTIFQSLYAFVQIYKDISQLKKEGIDVLISTQDPFEIGLFGFIISRISGLLLHVQIHTDISSRYMQKESIRSRIQILLASFVLRRADRVRVVSKRVKEYCVQRFPTLKARIDYVPMVYKNITPESAETALKARSGKRIFLVPTRFVPLKRIPYLIDAFAEVSKNDPSLILRIVGKGPDEKNILYAIQKNSLSNIVEIIPWVSNMESWYKNAYAVIVTSLYEGWCRVASEAVMNHTPVIMTNVGCAHEWLEDGKQGIVVPVQGKKALIDAISKIANDRSLHDVLVMGCVEKTKTVPEFTEYTKQIVASWKATISQSK